MTDKHKGNMKPSVIIGCVILFAVILAVGIAVMLGGQAEQPDVTPTTGTAVSAGTEASGETAESAATALTEAQVTTDPDGHTAPIQETDPAPETKPAPGPTEPEIQTPVTVPQMKEASYEQWLSASMVVGLSMSYPDFQLQGIYVTGETALENKMESGGACILFTSGGQSLALRSTPLEAERKTPGTTDLSAQAIGFATFDVVDAAAVDTSSMTAVELDDLGELIEQSMLVSLYWN